MWIFLCRHFQSRLANKIELEFEVERLEPLFASSADYEEFTFRHAKHQVPVKDLASYQGKAFLGIDAGSTTTKAALVGEDGTLLYSFYHNNDGDPLGTTIRAIKEIYSQLPEGVEIVHSCSTGYGEALIKAALLLDEGEVETVSHYYAAALFRTGCRLYSRHRRTGYEMYQNQESDGRQCSVKRSMLFRMWFFY